MDRGFPPGSLDKPHKPDSVYDWLLVAATIVLMIPFVVGNIVVFLKRKRRYFQATGWELTLGSSVAGTIWIFASLVVNQHFRRNKISFFSFCSLWTFWLQLTLGVCVWLSCMALRLHHLHTFCNTGKPPSCARVWGVYIPVMLAPAILFSTVATALKVCHHPCNRQEICVISTNAWRLSTFLLLPPLYFSVMILLLVSLRQHPDYLLRLQCQHAYDHAMMAFVLYLLTGATYLSHSYNEVEGRCFLTFSVSSIVFIHFWVHTGWPVYLCLFKKGDDMDKYEEQLRRRGARCLQQQANEPRTDGNRNGFAQAYTWAEEEAVLNAIAAEQTKKEILKSQKEHYQRELAKQREQLEELKYHNNVAVMPYNSQSLPPVRTFEKMKLDKIRDDRCRAISHTQQLTVQKHIEVRFTYRNRAAPSTQLCFCTNLNQYKMMLVRSM